MIFLILQLVVLCHIFSYIIRFSNNGFVENYTIIRMYFFINFFNPASVLILFPFSSLNIIYKVVHNRSCGMLVIINGRRQIKKVPIQPLI